MCTLDLPFYLFHLVSRTPASSHNIPSTPDLNHDLLLIRRHNLSHVPLDESVHPTLQSISHFSLPTASLMTFLKYSPVRKLTELAYTSLTCCCNCLIERGMDVTSTWINQLGKRIDIGADKLL